MKTIMGIQNKLNPMDSAGVVEQSQFFTFNTEINSGWKYLSTKQLYLNLNAAINWMEIETRVVISQSSE